MEDVSNFEFLLQMYAEMYHQSKMKDTTIRLLRDDVSKLSSKVSKLELDAEIKSDSFRVTDGYSHITEIE